MLPGVKAFWTTPGSMCGNSGAEGASAGTTFTQIRQVSTEMELIVTTWVEQL